MRLFKAFALAALVLAFGWEENTFIVVDRVRLESPKATEPLRILHLSDLHGRRIETFFSSFTRCAKELDYDLVALTGDIIAGEEDKDLNYVDYLADAFKGHSVYYVTGNHELANYSYLNKFHKAMQKNGFTLLDNRTLTLSKGSLTFCLGGLEDPVGSADEAEKIQEDLRKLETQTSVLSVLLAHRAVFTPYYNRSSFDLILTGHSHGGLVGLPFSDRGLYTRDQGFFPPYSKGLVGKTYISRGLGNAPGTMRLFNHPQFSVIEIGA